MKAGVHGPILTLERASDAVALEPNRLVGFDGAYCGAGAKPAGVSVSGVGIGEAVGLVLDGAPVVQAGGSFSAGDALKSDASGKVVAATAVAVDFPTSSSTAMKSSAEHPAFTVTGGVLPEAIVGYAIDDGASGAFVRVKLV
jgi:hypothetical protein